MNTSGRHIQCPPNVFICNRCHSMPPHPLVFCNPSSLRSEPKSPCTTLLSLFIYFFYPMFPFHSLHLQNGGVCWDMWDSVHPMHTTLLSSSTQVDSKRSGCFTPLISLHRLCSNCSYLFYLPVVASLNNQSPSRTHCLQQGDV